MYAGFILKTSAVQIRSVGMRLSVDLKRKTKKRKRKEKEQISLSD